LSPKLAYSIGALAASICSQAFAAYIIFFYVDVVRLPAYLATIGLLIFGVWNAINDPIAGFISDHSHFKTGRRIPYILYCAIPLGLIFFLIFSPPFNSFDELGFLFLYFVLAICLFDLFYTFAFINWSALYPEMFYKLKERTQVNALRQAFVFFGLLIGVALPPMIFGRWGWEWMGAILGAIVSISFLISLLGSREHLEYSHEHQLSFWPSIAATFKNRSFITFALANLLCQYAFVLILASMSFFAKYVLYLRPAQTTGVLAIAFFTALPMLFVWRFIVNRLGARNAYMLAMAVTALSLLPLSVITTESQARLTVVFIGMGISGLLLMVDVLLSDIIDEDELHTKTRREGMYFGTTAFISRFAIGLEALTIGWIFIRTAYNPYVFTQTREFISGVRFLMTGMPAIALLAAFVIISWYPLSGKKTFKKLHKDLEKLHEEKGVT